MQKIAQNLIRKHGLFDSFYIANLNILKNKIEEWKTYLPRVQPHYAVKCNPNTEMIKLMINSGLGFDCASKSEIETVLRLGGKPESILFMHPFKASKDIEYAVKNNIQYTTFDSYSELEKIKKYAPNIKCMIRLKVNNPSARVQLGLKYGIDKIDYQSYIDAAKDLNINLVGACYHVGSASKDPDVFKEGMAYAADVFAYAKQKGFILSILDIGGGFTTDNFKDCAKVINEELKAFDESIKIVAEPGRFFASDVFTFYSPIIGYKYKNNQHEYFIRDGLYGSFNCMIYDGQQPNFGYLKHPNNKNDDNFELIDSKLYGGTCDSCDTMGTIKLPYLNINDFITCENFGAYTISGAKDFNGVPMSKIKIFYIK